MSRYVDVQRDLEVNQYTWLVTGAAGFIGSNLVEKLLTLNQKVVGLDNFETGYQHNIDQALCDAALLMAAKDKKLSRDNFTFIEGDIRKKDDCLRACEGVDYVLHQAALGSVPRSIVDPIHTNKANIDGFLNMLVSARDARVKRFVYAASSSTYGDHPDLPKVEDRIGDPLSPYAVTKLVNELYANVFYKTYGINVIGLRYFNIFGKRQDPEGAYAAVIPKWISGVINGDDVFINGDGETSRDFCYIENAIQMNILAAMADDDLQSDVFNVALNERTTLNQLFNMIQNKVVERVSSLQEIEPTYRDFRQGDVRHSQADISRAEKYLGYVPGYRISDGLDKVVDWFLGKLK